ncbi:MAG: UDP-N-acetylmuramate dehydrogenase [bacterium]|nr:UDP-N-acetylmuramate dehydrogenase [bacterium]MDO8742376.1 UDP-N-acetylmuramate dehydrogenase [bacterium]
MNIQKYVPLAPLTTLGVGGSARFFVEVKTEKDIEEAVSYARAHGLAIYPIGAGSNILVPDEGVDGLVMKIAMHDIELHDAADETFLIAGAGARWEDVVNLAVEHGLYGIENLAGIPGTVGGAAVQNIGAYGAEFGSVFEYADVFNILTGVFERIAHTQASFAYRTSFFKEHRELVVVRVTLRLVKNAAPNISYSDLKRAQLEGIPLATPMQIAEAVRSIRAQKFPKNAEGGTAGSFFKNPIITHELADDIAKLFPDVPMFPQKEGMIKIPLAWLLDHVLALKGFSNGNVRLYEKHPLIIIARSGSRAIEVDTLAHEVAQRVFATTTICIEREVETFSGR